MLINPKLTVNDVKQIKILKNQLTQKELGKAFNVSRSLIGRIHRNEIWKKI